MPCRAVLGRLGARGAASYRLSPGLQLTRTVRPAGSGRCGTDARPIRFPAARFPCWSLRSRCLEAPLILRCLRLLAAPAALAVLAQAVLAQEPVWRHALSLFGE